MSDVRLLSLPHPGREELRERSAGSFPEQRLVMEPNKILASCLKTLKCSEAGEVLCNTQISDSKTKNPSLEVLN